MRSILTYIFVFLGLMGYSQNWLRSDGGQNNDEALSIDHDGIGNIYTAGYFNSACNFENTSLLSSGFSDIFVSKREADSDPVWAVKAGGLLPDRAFASKTDDQGNTVITGYFTFNAQFGDNINLSANAGSQDAFVAKLDVDGNFLWALPIGGELDDTGYGIDIDVNGNILVTGQFSGTGQFGPYSLESTIDPDTNSPSYDIFFMKLNPEGTVLWAKHGIAAGEDRGLDVSADSEGNMYISGQFSEDLTFDELHLNNVDNAGFIAKFDPDGNELWFLKIAGLYVLCGDVEVDHNDDVLLLGDYGGQLALFYTPLQYLDDSHTYNFFISKFSPTGDLLWIDQDGSDSEVSAKALSIETDNSANIAGTFMCVMDEYSGFYGDGLFNSVGFRDVFITKYSTNGEWNWARQFGGPKDDQCQAISVFIDDLPIIAGGFDGYFNVPSTNNFGYDDDENIEIEMYGDNYYLAYCDDPFYGSFVSVQTEGNRDIFITSPYSPEKGVYDYYNRWNEPPCSFGVVEPCINDCSDFAEECEYLLLNAYTNSGNPGYIGPEVEYLWNDATDDPINVAWNSGIYSVEIERVDGCNFFVEELDVTIHELPPYGTFTDDHGIYVEVQTSGLSYDICDPDTLTIWVTVPDTCDSYWSYMGQEFYTDSFSVSETSNFTYVVVSPQGCLVDTYIDVDLIESPNYNIIPGISLVDQNGFYETDTINICPNEGIEVALFDSLTMSNYIPSTWDSWIVSPSMPIWYASGNNIYLYPSQSGTLLISGQLHIDGNDCFNDLDFPPLLLEVYINILEEPDNNPLIIGDPFFCPGDTSLLVVVGGDNYVWSSPPIIEQLSSDSVLTQSEGMYYVESTMISADGCSSEEEVSLFLQENPIPQIYTVPADGIICPEDSILITTNEGASWQWISPEGIIVGEGNSLYTEIPGFYHCIITDEDGCTMESNFVEVNQYNSPYLLAYPGVTFCNDEEPIEITIQTNPEATVNWFPPLSGSSFTQELSAPGEYTVAVSLCGISDTLTITLLPSETPADITPEYEGEICPGEEIVLYANPGMEDYLWLPNYISGDSLIVSEPGTYTLTTTDTAGCMGVSAPYIASIYDLPPPSSSDTTFCMDEEVELIAFGVGEVSWYTDSELTNEVNVGQSYTITEPIDPSVFYIIQEDSICSSLVQEISLTTNPVSLPIISDSNSPVCIGDSLILTIPDGLDSIDYLWTDSNGNEFLSANVDIPSAAESDAGQWTVYQFDTQCESPVDTLWVEIIVPNPIVLNSDDITLCFYDTLELSALETYQSYNWFPDNENSESILVNNSGVYWLEVQDENACQIISDSVIVIVEDQIPSPVIDDASICPGEAIVLSVDTGYYVSWFDENSNLMSSDYTWITPELLENTNYYVLYYDDLDCESLLEPMTISLQISGPSVDIIGLGDYCVGDSLSLSLSETGPNYSWDTPSGEYTTESIYIEEIGLEDAGVYSVQITSPDCEVDSDPFDVFVAEYPDVDLSQSGYCLGGSYYFELYTEYDEYFWNGNSGNYFYEVIGSELIEVQVINYPGCSTSDEIYIDPSDCPEIIPNVFSPNNDQWNDEIDFALFYSRIESIIIFNRWGTEIRTLSGTKLIWDGKMNNGKDASDGVYYYIINSSSSSDSSHSGSGSIQLLR